MDILSFILGISFVVVIAVAVVAVIGFVRVNRVKSHINDITQTMDRENEIIYRNMNENLEQLKTEFSNEIENIHRTMDSRFDKLENKLTIKK